MLLFSFEFPSRCCCAELWCFSWGRNMIQTSTESDPTFSPSRHAPCRDQSSMRDSHQSDNDGVRWHTDPAALQKQRSPIISSISTGKLSNSSIGRFEIVQPTTILLGQQIIMARMGRPAIRRKLRDGMFLRKDIEGAHLVPGLSSVEFMKSYKEKGIDKVIQYVVGWPLYSPTKPVDQSLDTET